MVNSKKYKRKTLFLRLHYTIYISRGTTKVSYFICIHAVNDIESRVCMTERWEAPITIELLNAVYYLLLAAIVVKYAFPRERLLISAPIRNKKLRGVLR